MTRGKYAEMLDPEYWGYVDRINAWFPPDVGDLPIAEQRKIYNAMCRALHAGRPAGVEVRDSVISAPGRAIPIRRYRVAGAAPRAAVLYFHGGGFVLGNLDSHDDICAEICARTGFEVVSVDYRLAPEHIHPAAFDDALASFQWLAASFQGPIVLCGESAGGSLASSVALAARGGESRAAGQVLIYPGLGGDVNAGSYVEHAEAPMLTVRDIEYYRRMRTGSRAIIGDATLEPLAATDFSGLPPTLIFTAQCDPLSSDGEIFCDRIVAAGGKARWHEEPRLTHSYLRARTTVPRAAEAFARIIAALTALGRGDWPA